MSLLGRFISANRRASRALTPVHVHEANVFGVYRKVGTVLLSHPKVCRVLDVGAGRDWQFPAHYKRWYGLHLIGLDISAEEMSENTLLDERLVSDACRSIPVEAGTIDLVTVHSGIEHFSDNGAFLRHAYAALRPGGFLLAQFPGRWAPFAIANRLLPSHVKRRFLDDTMASAAGHLGFDARYDRTSHDAFQSMAREAGLEPKYYSPGYYSSTYAEFLLPLWLMSYCYDTLRYAVGWRNLASYNLFLLRKPDDGADDVDLELEAWPDLPTVRPSATPRAALCAEQASLPDEGSPPGRLPPSLPHVPDRLGHEA